MRNTWDCHPSQVEARRRLLPLLMKGRRLIHHEQSSAYRILKAKYFPQGTFMTAAIDRHGQKVLRCINLMSGSKEMKMKVTHKLPRYAQHVSSLMYWQWLEEAPPCVQAQILADVVYIISLKKNCPKLRYQNPIIFEKIKIQHNNQ